MSRLTWIVSASLFIVVVSAHGENVGTGFTYQGFFNDGGGPANGEYDFEFRLFDNPTTGVQEGFQTVENVQVTKGVFQVDLDMGGVFSGKAYWLQIGVRPGDDAGPYTILTPRQALTGTPYALGLRPGAQVVSDQDTHTLTVANGTPSALILLEKVAIDALTSDGKAVRALSEDGNAIYAHQFGTSTTNSAIFSETDSAAWFASAVYGRLNADPAGLFSSAVIGLSTSSGTSSIGVWGANNGGGPGVFGSSSTGPGVLASSGSSGSNAHGVSATTNSPDSYGGYFENNADTDSAAGLFARGGTDAAPDIILGGSSGSLEDGRIVSDPRFPGSDIFIESNDAVVVRLDKDGNGEDADFEIRQKDNNLLFNLDDSGILLMYQPTGALAFRFEPTEAAGDGAQLTLFQTDGTASIILDAEYGVGGPGRITTQELQITGGSDLSEHFTVREDEVGLTPQPGMVVCIDPDHPGELTVSTRPYDRTVAGVISGAGGVRTGLMMGQQGKAEADGAHAVALTGRVYVWADASFGPIAPGDLLTTSATPGHAMKVSDHAQAQGAILGKAMSRLDEGRGLVLVLVSLQ
ncbi:MAG: hypothetical protein Kow0059_21940 [Candidatus Sumerlaeia bacterium]